MHVQFMQWKCSTLWRFYHNGKPGLELVAAKDCDGDIAGRPIAKATVDTELRLEIDEILVKDYDENEGMAEALVASGVVEPGFSPAYVGTWQNRCARCRLTRAARQEAYSDGPHRGADLS
jgi:hypothetical protein